MVVRNTVSVDSILLTLAGPVAMYRGRPRCPGTPQVIVEGVGISGMRCRKAIACDFSPRSFVEAVLRVLNRYRALRTIVGADIFSHSSSLSLHI